MTDEYMDLRCRWCGQRFYVCLRCYHGEAYCCQECAAEGYRAVQDEARARHQSSEAGKEDHRDRMRELRAHKIKAVTDEGIVKLPGCGKVVPDFGTAASRVDEPVPKVEEHSDVAAMCDWGSLRPGPPARRDLARGTRGTLARCALCGTVLVLRRASAQARAG